MPMPSPSQEGSQSWRGLPVSCTLRMEALPCQFECSVRNVRPTGWTGGTDLWGTQQYNLTPWTTQHMFRQIGVSRNVENGTHVILEHQNWWSSEASCAFCCASPLGVPNSLPFPTRGKQQANHWLTTGIHWHCSLPFMLLILIFWSGNTGAGDGTTTSLWLAIQVSPGPCTTGTVGWLGYQFAFIGTIWILFGSFCIYLVFLSIFMLTCWDLSISIFIHCSLSVLQCGTTYRWFNPGVLSPQVPNRRFWWPCDALIRPLDRYFLDHYSSQIPWGHGLIPSTPTPEELETETDLSVVHGSMASMAPCSCLIRWRIVTSQLCHVKTCQWPPRFDTFASLYH